MTSLLQTKNDVHCMSMLDNFLFLLNIILTKLSYYTDHNNITDNQYKYVCRKSVFRFFHSTVLDTLKVERDTSYWK